MLLIDTTDDSDIAWTTASSDSSDTDMLERKDHKRKRKESSLSINEISSMNNSTSYSVKNNDYSIPIRKDIKLEERDEITHKKKKKKKNKMLSNNSSLSDNIVTDDETFLNRKVKQEIFSETPIKLYKKKKHKYNTDEENESTNCILLKEKSDNTSKSVNLVNVIKNEDSMNSNTNKSNEDYEATKKKTKKEKKNKVTTQDSSLNKNLTECKENNHRNSTSSQAPYENSLTNDHVMDVRYPDDERLTIPIKSKRKKHKYNTDEENESKNSILSKEKSYDTSKSVNLEHIIKNEDSIYSDINKSNEHYEAKKKKKKKDKKNKSKTQDSFLNDNLTESEENTHRNSTSSQAPYENSLTNDHVMDERYSDDERLTINNDNQILSQSLSISSTKPSLTISERIIFEGEKSNYVDASCSDLFNKYMQQDQDCVEKKIVHENHSVLSQDDDIWVIKGPCEISSNSFSGITLSLDSKFKVKSNGVSYDGNVEDKKGTLSLLCHKNNLIIENIPIKGVIYFRKRIPKPNIMEDHVTSRSCHSIIPLPLTKCRHPLFGAHYKSAVTIPSVVSAQLQGASTAEHSNQRKKRKRVTTEEVSPVVPSKKKKKKCQVSNETWDNEQEIEQNLFHF